MFIFGLLIGPWFGSSIIGSIISGEDADYQAMVSFWYYISPMFTMLLTTYNICVEGHVNECNELDPECNKEPLRFL